MESPNFLLLGTRKGLVIYRFKDQKWIHDTTQFLGIPVSLTNVDKRDNKGDNLTIGTTTGNVFTSTDGGENWSVLTNYLSIVYSVELI